MSPVSLQSHSGPSVPTFGFPMLFIASKEALNQIHSGDLTTWYNHSSELVQGIVFIVV